MQLVSIVKALAWGKVTDRAASSGRKVYCMVGEHTHIVTSFTRTSFSGIIGGCTRSLDPWIPDIQDFTGYTMHKDMGRKPISVIRSYSLVNGYQHFKRTPFVLKSTSTWWWRHLLLKWWFPSTRLNSVMAQKNAIWIFTDLSTICAGLINCNINVDNTVSRLGKLNEYTKYKQLT
jgi:hypothetical protein